MPLKDALVILGYKGVTFYSESILVIITMVVREATVNVLVMVLGSMLDISAFASCGLKTL